MLSAVLALAGRGKVRSHFCNDRVEAALRRGGDAILAALRRCLSGPTLSDSHGWLGMPCHRLHGGSDSPFINTESDSNVAPFSMRVP